MSDTSVMLICLGLLSIALAALATEIWLPNRPKRLPAKPLAAYIILVALLAGITVPMNGMAYWPWTVFEIVVTVAFVGLLHACIVGGRTPPVP